MVYEYHSDDMNFPSIKFDEGRLEIIGESYMENPFEFYLPILILIKEQIRKNINFIFECKLTYTNTSSNKCIHQILDILKDNIDKGKNIKINWYYDDNEMLSEIKEFEQELNLEINKLEIEF
jgi:SiaC family regulatory phosphoprotein